MAESRVQLNGSEEGDAEVRSPDSEPEFAYQELLASSPPDSLTVSPRASRSPSPRPSGYLSPDPLSPSDSVDVSAPSLVASTAQPLLAPIPVRTLGRDLSLLEEKSFAPNFEELEKGLVSLRSQIANLSSSDDQELNADDEEIIISLDADGCLFNADYHRSESKDVVDANPLLLADISRLIRRDRSGTPPVFMVGSNRQSREIDEHMQKIHGGSARLAIPEIARYVALREHKKIIFDPVLLADIKDQDRDVFNATIEQSKLLLLYMQMHRAAARNPHKRKAFHFYDDDDGILKQLKIFFEKHPDLIPNNLTLHLHHYGKQKRSASFDNTKIAAIKGTGPIDRYYKNSILELHRSRDDFYCDLDDQGFQHQAGSVISRLNQDEAKNNRSGTSTNSTIYQFKENRLNRLSRGVTQTVTVTPSIWERIKGMGHGGIVGAILGFTLGVVLSAFTFGAAAPILIPACTGGGAALGAYIGNKIAGAPSTYSVPVPSSVVNVRPLVVANIRGGSTTAVARTADMSLHFESKCSAPTVAQDVTVTTTARTDEEASQRPAETLTPAPAPSVQYGM